MGEALISRFLNRKSARRDKPATSEPRDAAVHTPSEHIGHRRSQCWWEPIFNPALEDSLESCDWYFQNNSGPSAQFIYGPSLSEKVEKGDTYKLSKITFKDCDFQGRFDPSTIIMFDECSFIGCDFAYSHWKDANFRKCTFEDCSISLATFERCEFRDCSWLRIGISGSKTDFSKCFITNPWDLVEAGFSGTRKSDKTVRHRMYQWFRLQSTKAHLARTVMLCHEHVGDDQTFYQTAKLHDLQGSYARISASFFNLAFADTEGRVVSTIRMTIYLLENILLRLFGIVNSWGASATRPFLAIGALFLVFGEAYKRLPFATLISSPYQKSFNITSLAGYGNEYVSDNSFGLTLVQNIHVCLSIVIYTVFFGTVISRISRVR